MEAVGLHLKYMYTCMSLNKFVLIHFNFNETYKFNNTYL